jgi:hypothetical protein
MSELPNFNAHCKDACIKVWGEPSKSTKDRLTWKSSDGYGFKSYDIKKLCWYDSETKRGGGLMQLAAYCLGIGADTKISKEVFLRCWRYAYEQGWLPDRPPDRYGGTGNGKARRRSAVVARYIYCNEKGQAYLRVNRTAAKTFFQERWDGSAWIKGKPKGAKVPYRLPELLKAPPNAPIYICEGEKDADNLANIGFVATTASEGAGKWSAELDQWFKNRHVLIVADNDQPGRRHSYEVARSLHRVVASVRILELPDLPDGGDVSDWLEKDPSGARLVQLGERTPLWQPSPDAKDATGRIELSHADQQEITRLAKLPLIQYDRERIEAAKQLKVRATAIDLLVEAERANCAAGDTGKQGRAITFFEIEPWSEVVDRAVLLDSIAEAIGNHVVMPDCSRYTGALWVVHSYLLDCFLVSPRLAVRSPVKQCGKTTLIDVLARLVWRPLSTANLTAAAAFRVVEAYRPTLLVDEADTFLRDNDELRGIINSGHRRNGAVLRTVGDDHEPRSFATYSGCAIALIGNLPDTLHDRSVVIDLKRRLPSERIEPFRPDRARHLDDLARKAARWAKDHANRISEAHPEMPPGIYNREADNWRPLLAIADAAGGHWPERAGRAVMQNHNSIRDDDSRLVVLLTDIRTIFTEKDIDRLASADLAKALAELEGRPWAEYGKRGNPFSQNQLARLLKPLAIAPDSIRLEGQLTTLKGYKLDQFTDAFARFLPPDGGSEPEHRNNADEMSGSGAFQSGTTEADVPDGKHNKPCNERDRSAVPGQSGAPSESDVPTTSNSWASRI